MKGIEHTYTAEQLMLLTQHNVTSEMDRRAKAAYSSVHEALGAEADRLCAGMTMLVRVYERQDSGTSGNKGNRTDVTLCMPELAGQERIRGRSLIMFYRLVVAPDLAAFRAMSPQDRQKRFVRFKQECAGKAADEAKPPRPPKQPKRQKPSRDEVDERRSAEDAELIWDVWTDALRDTVPLYLAHVQLLEVGPAGLVPARGKPCVEIHETEDAFDDETETETETEDASEDATETEDAFEDDG